MKKPNPNERRGPEPLAEVLGRLFAARGWGRKQDRIQLEQVWREVVGEEYVPHTRISSLRRGVLEIIVANAVLLQELAHFHKRRLLEQLRSRLPNKTIHDLRFRAGVMNPGE